MIRGRWKPGIVLILAIAVITTFCIACLPRRSPIPPPEDRIRPGEEQPMFRLDVFHVGYGDCMLIRTPQGRTAMVDCGSQEAGTRIAEKLDEMGVERLDLLVITHPHPDHVNGLSAFIDRVEISRILESGLEYEDSLHDSLLDQAREMGIPVTKAEPGMTLDVLGNEITAEVLHLGRYDNLNEASIVTRFTYGSKVFLLLADAELEAEKLLLEEFGADGIKADVVKIGHHANTSNHEFIRAVSAEIAVATLGPNQWDAPDMATIQAWEASGARVLRTDVHGDVSVSTDGKTLHVETTLPVD